MDSIFDKFNLKDRSVIVTGGAGLLGRQFCMTLAQAGAGVVVADFNLEAAEGTALSITARGMLAAACKVDVTDPKSVAQMVAYCDDKFGGPDILVCSAAKDPKFDEANHEQSSNAFETFPLDAWKQALDVNLTGMFLCAQAAASKMVSRERGVIINICSTYGLVGPDQRIYEKPGKPDQFKPVYYSVTKAGVLGLTRYLATYFAGKNIRANALTPGGVYNNHDEVFTHNYSSRTVLGRMAKQDEMNGALLFLASDASSYMTGSNVVVDGGWTAW
jgi:NAD(P)-dependent dehydrogenase (short-subunit alcohol dehydrogenase family)